jgi:signal transduction histidine kinase
VGQAAIEKQRILLTQVPPDYVQISSGLGEATPMNIIVLPIVFEGDVKGVLELASFSRFNQTNQTLLEQLAESMGIVINSIAANMKTEQLLSQSQAMAEELQAQQEELTETNRRLEEQARSLQASEELLKTQQEELQQSNEELEEKARLLLAQNTEVERKNREVEEAKLAMEDKARQLTLTSKYKSEFLANMSHELRTPLNSLLILAKLLSENPDENLTDKQVEFAKTIYGSGVDLLTLINDILDLSKIESGMMSVNVTGLAFPTIGDFVERNFRHVADEKGLDFTIDLSPELPEEIFTDEVRLQQVLKNLLSNAFKFTESGGVGLRIEPARAGWTPGHEVLDRASSVISFAGQGHRHRNTR